MTVKQLIEELNKHGEDETVDIVIGDEDGDDFTTTEFEVHGIEAGYCSLFIYKEEN